MATEMPARPAEGGPGPVFADGRPEGRGGELVARLMAAKAPEQPVLERSAGGLLIVDSNLAITDANGEMLAIVGLSRRDLVGRPLSAYFQVPETAANAIHQAFVSGGAAMFELALRSSRSPSEGGASREGDSRPIRCIFAASLR